MPINSFLYPGAKVTPAYEVANSWRNNNPDSSYMHITPSSAGNKRIWTFSTWLKRSKLSYDCRIFSTLGSSGGPYGALQFGSDDRFVCWSYNGSGNDQYHRTNRLFRDTSAWYHIVMAVDTTQGSASNRTKIYFNGVQETSWLTETTHDQNDDSEFNHDTKWFLGAGDPDDSQLMPFDGYMAETVFIDGTQYAASDFGEFDEDSPTIWKPKDVSGLTFGTNGFYLDYEDSANLGNDANGGTDLTEVNVAATDQATDTPTNNFCTINVLDNESGNITISEGNLNFTVTGNADETNRGTFGFTKGKWYFESKYVDDSCYVLIGVASASDADIATPKSHMEMAGYYSIQIDDSSPGTRPFDNGSAGSGLGNSAEDDIHMYAIDMDNNRFYAGKNGTWYSSGDPAGNSNPLIEMDDGFTTLMPSICTKQDGIADLNFGSPFYAISSGNADGNGYGNFEYSVPSGYYSLCTKNLAEFG